MAHGFPLVFVLVANLCLLCIALPNRAQIGASIAKQDQKSVGAPECQKGNFSCGTAGCTDYWKNKTTDFTNYTYMAEWVVRDNSFFVTITTKISPGRWTAIGFNTKPQMPNGDALMVQMDTNLALQAQELNLFGDGSLQLLRPIPIVQSSYQNGLLQVTVSRPLIGSGTGNFTVLSLLNQPVYLLLPFSGGPYVSRVPKMHSEFPHISSSTYTFVPCN